MTRVASGAGKGGEHDEVTVRQARESELEQVRQFYRATGYDGGAAIGDRVFISADTGGLIGVVRLVREFQTTVLRGMRVAEGARRRGVGTRLLGAVRAALHEEECFCLPYRYLAGFYGQIGFGCVEPADAPAFLAARLANHHARRAGDFVLMRRPAGRARDAVLVRDADSR